MNINKEKMQLAMANACMNTTQLSKKADISRFSLNAYVNKTRNPKPATVGRIAKALNVKVEDLVEQCCNTDQAKSEAMKSRMKG